MINNQKQKLIEVNNHSNTINSLTLVIFDRYFFFENHCLT